MSNDTEHPDPDDMFKDTRMSFGDHIEDLRTHLFRALKGFAIGMILGIWPLGSYVLAIIVDPLDQQLFEFEKRKLKKEKLEANERFNRGGRAPRAVEVKMLIRKDQIQKAMGKGVGQDVPPPLVLDKVVKGFERLLYDLDALDLIDQEIRDHDGNYVEMDVRLTDPRALVELVLDQNLEVRRPKPSTMHITEAFMVYFKVAMMTGLVISSPWVFYHLWMFIAAGLYPQEKKLVNIYLPFSLFLFIAGVLICQFLVMPRAIEGLLKFNEWFGFSADLRLNEWLGFALIMPILFGACFQTPLVMMFLHRVGIMTVQTYRDYRRIAFFTMAAFAMIFLPTPDPQSMIFLWVPMIGLYELGILLCIWQGEHPLLGDWDQDETKSNELVEV